MTAESPENKTEINQSDLDKLRAKINLFKNQKQNTSSSLDIELQHAESGDTEQLTGKLTGKLTGQLYVSEAASLLLELTQLIEVWEKSYSKEKNSYENRPSAFSFNRKSPHHTECMSLFYSLDKDLQSMDEEVELEIKCIEEIDSSAEVLPLFDLLDKELGGTSSPREEYLDTLMSPPAALSHSRLERAIRVYTQETKELPPKPDDRHIGSSIIGGGKEIEIDQTAVPTKLNCLIAFIIDVLLASLAITLGGQHIPEIDSMNAYFSQSIMSIAYEILPKQEFADAIKAFEISGVSISPDHLFRLSGIACSIAFAWLVLNIFFSIIFQSTLGQRLMGIVICKFEYYKAGAFRRVLRVIFSTLNVLSLGLRFMLLARKNMSYYCSYSGTILAKRNKIILLEEVKDID